MAFLRQVNASNRLRRLRSRQRPSPIIGRVCCCSRSRLTCCRNATRIITADQSDRHLLLNKAYWSEYSLQFNTRRWDDDDGIKVNYIGHPMEAAIAGYIEVQNDPRGRELRISRSRRYWNSRFRAFLWETVYSTYWEIGPTGETAISGCVRD
jgi:hypothetical protein